MFARNTPERAWTVSAFFISLEHGFVSLNCVVESADQVFAGCFAVGSIVKLRFYFEHFDVLFNGRFVVILLLEQLGSHIHLYDVFSLLVEDLKVEVASSHPPAETRALAGLPFRVIVPDPVPNKAKSHT